MNLSIRSRMTLVIAAIFILVLFIVASLTVWMIRSSMQNDLQQELLSDNQRVTQVVEAFIFARDKSPTSSFEELKQQFLQRLKNMNAYQNRIVAVKINLPKSHSIFAAGGVNNLQLYLPDNIFTLDDGFSNTSIVEAEYRILSSQHEWGHLIVGKENLITAILQRGLLDSLLLAIPFIILLTIAAGQFLARRVMKPAVDAAKAADAISLKQPGHRLPESGSHDEFASLVATLNRMIERLEKGALRIQQFTQDAAHELRTPLTIQRGELELLFQSSTLHEGSKLSVQKSLDRAIKMGRIVDNLLLLARSDSGDYPLEKSRFSLSDVLIDAIEDTRILLEEKPVEVIVEIESLDIVADNALINRLVYGLAENAVKFTQTGHITFCLEKQGQSAVFTIHDSGCGIEKELLPHIFERFYGGKRSASGSGLGLAICKWIAEAHQGTIEIKNNTDSGTLVRVVLPL